jgi:hypothetical protein
MSFAKISPAKIRDSLPNTMIIDVIDQGQRFRYRFAGTAVDGHCDNFLTDRYTDEVEAYGLNVQTTEILRQVVSEGLPNHVDGRLETPDGLIHFYEWLALPLSSDGVFVDTILAGARYRPVEFPELETFELSNSR